VHGPGRFTSRTAATIARNADAGRRSVRHTVPAPCDPCEPSAGMRRLAKARVSLGGRRRPD
jgi:hypothetical protein